MRLDALIQMAKIARAMMDEGRIIVFGSSILLPRFPELGDDDAPLSRTNDADFIIDPWDQEVGEMLNDALGREELFHKRFGYYADIIRPVATEQFPPGWESRLIPLVGVDHVFCIEPHDMGAAKLQAGRPKDIELLTFLLKTGRIDDATLEKRLFAVEMRKALIVKSFEVLKTVRERVRAG